MWCQLFEKLASENEFQTEREKPYDYLLIIQTLKNSREKVPEDVS